MGEAFCWGVNGREHRIGWSRGELAVVRAVVDDGEVVAG